MSQVNPVTRDLLDNAIAEKDPILVRSIIVTVGEQNLKEALAAYKYAIAGGDPLGIVVKHDPEFVFQEDSSQWNRDYFIEHTQKMMRNFSREAFDHYLKVGAKVFPARMRIASQSDTAPKLPSSIPKNATIVTIGIGVAIVLAIAGFVRFLFWVIPKLRGLAGSSKNAVTANEAALSSANHALSTIHEFDQEKFRSTAIVTYNKADFNRAVAVNNRVVNEIDHGAMTVLVKQLTATINSGTLTREVVAEIDKKATGMVRGISGNADVKAVLGLDITITNGKISAHSKGTPSIKPTKETAGSHGWNVSDAHTVVNAAIGIAHHNDALAAHIENTTKLCESLGEEMKSFNKSTNVSENEKEAMKSAMASIRGIIDVSLDEITRALETNRSITRSALNVAKAAIAAKK